MSIKSSHLVLALASLVLALLVQPVTQAKATPPLNGYEEPWKVAVRRINDHRDAGVISVDEAALLRFRAISDPQILPKPYRPSPYVPGRELIQPQPQDGTLAVAYLFQALYEDQNAWSSSTHRTIEQQLSPHGHSRTRLSGATLISLNKTFETEHFLIRWTDQGADAPPGGEAYIESIVEELEFAWEAIGPSGLGYILPDPQDYRPSQQKIEVDVVDQIKICSRWPTDFLGVAGPGLITLLNDIDDKADLATLAAHELFHLVQYRYAGFFDTPCALASEVELWMANGNGWFAEASATWVEDEVHPSANNYLGHLPSYLLDPDISLFARREPAAPGHEYGAVVFVKFLQEHIAPASGYTEPASIVRDIWENVSPANRSTVDAVTHVLQNPPSGEEPFEGEGSAR